MLDEYTRSLALGVDQEVIERVLKDACHDDRCTADVSDSDSYRALCLNHSLTCLTIRVGARIRCDDKNGYPIPASLRADMEQFVADPVSFFVKRKRSILRPPQDGCWTRTLALCFRAPSQTNNSGKLTRTVGMRSPSTR